MLDLVEHLWNGVRLDSHFLCKLNEITTVDTLSVNSNLLEYFVELIAFFDKQLKWFRMKSELDAYR